MLATISCSLYRVVQWTRKLGHKKPEEKPPKRIRTNMYVEVSFCFVPFRFNAFAGFVSGFRTSRKLGAWTGDRFSFSVARDQMLVAWGDRASIKLSRRNGPRRHWIDINWVPVDLSICLHLSEWHICIFCPTAIVVSTLRVSTTKNDFKMALNLEIRSSERAHA